MARLEYKASPTVGNSETHRIHFETAAVISEDRGEEIEGGTAVTLRVFVYLRVCVFMYLCICVFVYLSAIWEAGGEETGGGSVP